MKLLALLLLTGVAMADTTSDRLPDLATLERRAEVLKQEPKKDPHAWGWDDTALQVLFGATMLGDYLQTRKITREGDEMNPIMGRRGQRVPPELYFPAALALHTLAMRALPQPYRRVAQGLSVGFEGGVVGRNLGLGYGFRF